MICPACSHEAISFSRFLLVAYPKQLTCSKCGAELTWSARWRQVFHRSIVACAVIAVVLAVLFLMAGIGLGIYIAVGLVIWLVFDIVYWRRSIYEKTA